MRKTIVNLMIGVSLASFSMTSYASENWSFGEDDASGKMSSFEDRKVNVIKRLEDGKVKLNDRMDKRIECAKNSQSPKEMRACHQTYRLNFTEKPLKAPIE